MGVAKAGRGPWTSTAIHARLLPALLGLCGSLLVLVSTSLYGPGLSDDSVSYISAAQSLLDGRGYTTFDGYWFVVHPPLFPTLLAVASLGQLGLVEGARYVNALCFGMLIVLSTRWVFMHTTSLAAMFACSAVLLLSKPLLHVSTRAWSEPLFLLLVLASLFQMERFLRLGDRASLCLSAGFVALACLTRYLGVVLILTGVILLLSKPSRTRAARLRHVSVFVAISTLPLVAWLARNYLTASTPFGVRPPSPDLLDAQILLAVDTASTWFLPTRVPLLPRLITSGVLLASTAAIMVLAARSGPDDPGGRDMVPMAPLLVFTILYSAVLVVVASTVTVDPIDHRLMSPIYPPMLLWLVFACTKADSLHRGWMRRVGRLGLLLAFVVWSMYPAREVVGMVRQYLNHGAGGFRTVEWVRSDLADYLRRHGAFEPTFGNSPPATYLSTGTVCRLSPRRPEASGPTGPLDDLARFDATLERSGQVYLVWFDRVESGHLYSVAELASRYRLSPVATRDDGAVYRVEGHRQ